jgi:small subunit ribosomal protein S11
MEGANVPMEPTESAVLDTTSSADAVATSVATPVVPVVAGKKKKSKRPVTHGQVHVLATFNNTIITFTDSNGGVLSASSAGACGFRGSKKGTAYAAQVACEKAGAIARQAHGFAKADVIIKGVGLGREAAVRSLGGMQIVVESIKDVTGLPHGGCRPKKARRM